MEKQFSGATFFDQNIDSNIDNYLMPIFYQKNNGKKRIINNSIIVRYLNNEKLSVEELRIAKQILTGEVFNTNKNKYGHCKLCSKSFNDYSIKNLSNDVWQIGFPTQPYTPFGLMYYLTNRKIDHKENFYSLSDKEFYSLIDQIKILYKKISKSDFSYHIVGINVLFNQLNVSQRCIHGHVEPMIANINDLGLGCNLQSVSSDLFTDTIRLKCDHNYNEVMELIKFYMNITREEIENVRKKQLQYFYYKQLDYDIRSISPAPTINIYLTYYRDCIYLSLARDLYQQPICSKDVNMEDEFIYNLKYNSYAIDDKSKLLYQRVPVLRPSIKVNHNVYSDEIKYQKDLNSLKRILSL